MTDRPKTRSFDVDEVRRAATLIRAGEAHGSDERLVLAWAVARLYGECCTFCGSDTTKRSCHCENDE